ncbi:MAG: acyl carrier protein [Lachnospiraceae bacterium]|nr:acyl carrier protein [Lachnospiraceae bacterium]
MLEKIRDFLNEMLALDLPELTEDMTFKSLGLDSLDELEMVMEFESRYDVKIPDDDLEKIESVGDFIECLNKLGVSE